MEYWSLARRNRGGSVLLESCPEAGNDCDDHSESERSVRTACRSEEK